MALRELEVKQSPPERHNDYLPDNQGYTSQKSILATSEGMQIAEVNAYLDMSYYGAWWAVDESKTELVQLVEKCIQHYEREHPNGIGDLVGGKMVGALTDKFSSGVVLFIDGFDQKQKLDYQRPLSWDRVLGVAEESKIRLARFNTPIGDFCIEETAEGTIFGVISRVKETGEFAKILSGTSSEGVSMEKAQEFFETALSGFEQVE
jgi:hypothetical protein